MLAKSSKLWKSAILGRWVVRIGDLALTWSPLILGRQHESLFVSVKSIEAFYKKTCFKQTTVNLDCRPLLQKHKPTFPSNGSLFNTEPVKIASIQSGLPIRPCTSSKTHHHPSIYLFPTANYFSSYISPRVELDLKNTLKCHPRSNLCNPCLVPESTQIQPPILIANHPWETRPAFSKWFWTNKGVMKSSKK